MRWRRRPARGTIGIDIGQRAVAVVAVRHAASGPRVEAAASCDLPAGALHGHAVRDPAAVGEAIRQLREPWIGRRRWPVVTAIPASAAMMRRLTVAAGAGPALDAAVVAEAAAMVPDGADHAVLDYHVLQTSPGATDVLAVAARCELVRSYTGAIRAARLEPAAVDVDVFALHRLWASGADVPPSGPVLLLHAGARSLSVTVVNGSVPTVAGDVAAGTAADTESLVAAVGREVDFLLPDLAERRGAVALSGPSARMADLVPALERRLRRPVGVLDPFATHPLAPPLERAVPVVARPGFAVAAGLALRRVERSWW